MDVESPPVAILMPALKIPTKFIEISEWDYFAACSDTHFVRLGYFTVVWSSGKETVAKIQARLERDVARRPKRCIKGVDIGRVWATTERAAREGALAQCSFQRRCARILTERLCFACVMAAIAYELQNSNFPAWESFF